MLEVIAFTIESCHIAAAAGADRIELCDNPGEGGTTPSYGMLAKAREATTLALFPIIRPRGGDFLYSTDEFDIMLTDIDQCRRLGCDGIVAGLLTEDGAVDKHRTRLLVEAAYPMEVTFHRAFDRTTDPLQALEDIIDCGCQRILTSGQKPTATEGADLIRTLVKVAGDRIIIMPGSGIRSDNIASLKNETGAMEFHSSARTTHTGRMKSASPIAGDTLQHWVLDAEEVHRMAERLKS